MRKMLLTLGMLGTSVAWSQPALKAVEKKAALPGTKLLVQEGDLSISMIEGMDRFLDGEIARVMTSPGSAGGSRDGLAKKLGLHRDARPPINRFVYASTLPGSYAATKTYSVYQVRWKAFGDLEAHGLLLEPNGESVANVVALPPAHQSPSSAAGLVEAKDPLTPFAAELASLGCRVVIPQLIDRSEVHGMPRREWLHRSAWELGRTIAGYEVHQTLAAVDCFARMEASSKKTLVIGQGEGARIAFYAAALDERIGGTYVGGYFGNRAKVWDELADRTVFGLLNGHRDAGILQLIAPRPVVIDSRWQPDHGHRLDKNGNPERLRSGIRHRGKPGRLLQQTEEEVRAELKLAGVDSAKLVGDEGKLATWPGVLSAFGIETKAVRDGMVYGKRPPTETVMEDDEKRHEAFAAALDRHNQWALLDGERVRTQYLSGVKTDSVANFEKSIAGLREKFRNDVIGEFATLNELLPPNAKTRTFQEGPKTISYEVVLDVHKDFSAYGILTLPKDLKLDGSERRPVVVCQHGLEGRPQDTVGKPSYHYYKAFATSLAERGFITFSPQNIYLGWDLFRIQQFKANAVGCTLFSLVIPQHRQITNWLAGLSYVDPERIGFYGLSYGGKSAMRIPPLVDRYCLSICSADFNEWVWKNAATDPLSARYSYANKSEYEIFEWDLGNTFNYYEMAALICPRPFMVERGHFDGVAPDKTVAYEYAKVRFLYAAKLGLGDRTEIEWFVGPHTINGKATYEFLHRHLKWPAP